MKAGRKGMIYPMAAGPADNKRADNNRERAIAALRRFHELLAIAADPNFDGTIAVEISSKGGCYGRPKYTQVNYDPHTSRE